MVGLVIAGMVLQRHLALSQGPVEHPEKYKGGVALHLSAIWILEALNSGFTYCMTFQLFRRKEYISSRLAVVSEG